MIPMLSAIAPLAKILFSTIEKAVPDKDLQERLKAQLNEQLLKSSTQELKAAASIVEAEAKAGWFAASWRPLLMYVLIFVLVFNYIFAPVIKMISGHIVGFELPGDVWTLFIHRCSSKPAISVAHAFFVVPTNYSRLASTFSPHNVGKIFYWKPVLL